MRTASTNVKILLIDRDTPTTQTAANLATAALVARTVTRGGGVDLAAESAYWLRPDQTVTVQLPTGPAIDQLVASVGFVFPNGLMDVTTRIPDNTGTIGA